MDNKTNIPKGFCYVEFLEEETVDKVLNELGETGLLIDERKVHIKRSQSVAKIRDNIKHVLHISNLNFKTKENHLKEFFESKGISSIKELIIIREDSGKSRGFGFVEFENEVNVFNIV
jgi:RNA recognition motif-containing protein